MSHSTNVGFNRRFRSRVFGEGNLSTDFEFFVDAECWREFWISFDDVDPGFALSGPWREKSRTCLPSNPLTGVFSSVEAPSLWSRLVGVPHCDASRFRLAPCVDLSSIPGLRPS